MPTNKYPWYDNPMKKKEEGFALVVSMMLLFVMTIMGSILVINATSQSKVVAVSESEHQTFLSAETGIQDAISWLSREVAKGNYPKNKSTKYTKLCEYDLGGSIEVAQENLNRNIIDDMNITNAKEKEVYDRQTYSWIVSQFQQSTKTNIGAGGSVTMGTGYSTGGSGSYGSYFYKIFACATDRNKMSTMLETIVVIPL
jgi:Tfp pilus assembly protein PilX